MTKEEQWIKESIENYIFAYTGKRAKISDADAQHFTASARSYLNLCAHSLPSNIDEAALQFARRAYSPFDDPYEVSKAFENDVNCFKAGAEWMAGQGQTFEAHVDNGCAIASGVKLPFVLWDTYEDWDVLKVQIRKKQ